MDNLVVAAEFAIATQQLLEERERLENELAYYKSAFDALRSQNERYCAMLRSNMSTLDEVSDPSKSSDTQWVAGNFLYQPSIDQYLKDSIDVYQHNSAQRAMALLSLKISTGNLTDAQRVNALLLLTAIMRSSGTNRDADQLMEKALMIADDALQIAGKMEDHSWAKQSEASQDQEINVDAASESEGDGEISSSDDDGPVSPTGSPPATTGGTDRSQRVLNRVRRVNIPNAAATEIVPRATIPDPPFHSDGRTLNDRLAVVPDGPDASPQHRLPHAENNIELHREEPPSKFSKYMEEADQILDQLIQGHAEYMNGVEQGRSTLIASVLGISKENAHGELPEKSKKSIRGDPEVDPLIEELDSMMAEVNDRNGGQDTQNPNARSDDSERSDLPAASRAQVDIGRTREPIVPYNTILKQMKRMTIEILHARIEIARVYQEWEKMASLAATAIVQSDLIGSKSFIATSNLQRGIALFNMRVYWEATKSFEMCQKWTENKEESIVVEDWLAKANQAQTRAQSVFSQSSVFNFDHMRPRTGTNSVPATPGALRQELDIGSDFDSVRGFGSRAPSVASIPVESPQWRRPTSVDRGSPMRSSPEPSLLSAHWTPTTPRISSPLAPRKPFRKEMQSKIDQQQNPIPTRTVSVGYKPPSRKQDQRPEPGRAKSVYERSLFGGANKSQGSYRAQSISKQPRKLRESLLDHRANLEEHRRQSELAGIEEFEALGRTSKTRSPSNLTDRNQMTQKLDRSAGKSDERPLRNSKADKKSLKPGDLQAEINSQGSNTPSPDKETASQKEPPTQSHNQKSVKPLTASSPDDDLPFHLKDARRKTWAELPILEYDDFAEENTQNKDTGTGPLAEPNQYEFSLAKELEGADKTEGSDCSIEELVESNAGTPSEQSPSTDSGSKLGGEESFVGEAPVEEGGPDDLYGIEDSYVPPSARSASKSPTPVTATETEKDSDTDNFEWEDVSPNLNAPPRPTEQAAHREANTGNEQPSIMPPKQEPSPVTETDDPSDDKDVEGEYMPPKPDTPPPSDEQDPDCGTNPEIEHGKQASEKQEQEVETPPAEVGVDENESMEQEVETPPAEVEFEEDESTEQDVDTPTTEVDEDESAEQKESLLSLNGEDAVGEAQEGVNMQQTHAQSPKSERGGQGGGHRKKGKKKKRGKGGKR
ncbi:m7GpppX diphosphatase [Physcia stellaris]|nr:m7GpppX diphosphatase [Physcia stellaris]